jgi:glycosyltransferase involved in cell wall biosynthesis
MRILMLIPTLTGGGAERQLVYLAGELQRRGHDVLTGFVHPGSGAWPDALAAHRFRARKPWNPLLVRDIVRLIRSWRPDIVQTCLPMMDVYGGIAAAIAGVPFLLREPNSGESYPGGIKPWLRLRVARHAAAGIVTNSPSGLDYWARRAPRLPRILIPNGVAAEAIAAAEPVLRPDHTAVGVYTGRFERQKNVDVLLRAAALVMAERDLILYLCGHGTERARLEALAEELGIAGRVHFTGFVPNVWDYQRAADFAVLLSDYEGHPNAVSECFAAGTPMILSANDAHRRLAPGGEALFVPLRDIAATAGAIREILRNRGAALERAERARRLASEWSIAGMTDAYLHTYLAASTHGLHDPD